MTTRPVPFTKVMCDASGCTAEHFAGQRHAQPARDAAQADGWRVSERITVNGRPAKRALFGGDFCPEHRPENVSPDVDHVADVEPHDHGLFRAVCSCGWASAPMHRSYAEGMASTHSRRADNALKSPDNATVTIPDELKDQVVVDLQTAAKVLGIGRNQAYTAAKAGEIPTFRLGKQYRVPVAKLLDLLGIKTE